MVMSRTAATSAQGHERRFGRMSAISGLPLTAYLWTNAGFRRYGPTVDMVVLFRYLENRVVSPSCSLNLAIDGLRSLHSLVGRPAEKSDSISGSRLCCTPRSPALSRHIHRRG